MVFSREETGAGFPETVWSGGGEVLGEFPDKGSMGAIPTPATWAEVAPPRGADAESSVEGIPEEVVAATPPMGSSEARNVVFIAEGVRRAGAIPAFPWDELSVGGKSSG